MIAYELWIYTPNANPALAYKSDAPDDYPIFNLKYKVEVNKTGSATFTVGVTHPLYSRFAEINTFVSILVYYIDNGTVEHAYCPFCGRIIEIIEDDIGNMEATCEGAYSILNDFVGRSGAIIGANYSTDREDWVTYTDEAIHHILDKMSWFSSLFDDSFYPGIYHDYRYDFFKKVSSAYNIDNLHITPESGPSIIYDKHSESEDPIYNDKSYKTYYEMLFETVLKKSGGFLVPVFDPFVNGSSNGVAPRTNTVNKVKCYWTYIAYHFDSYAGQLSDLVPYPNETYEDQDRTDWLPHFTKRYNAITITKESSIKSKTNAVIPLGKDDLDLTGYPYPDSPNKYIIKSSSSNYKALLPTIVKFENITDIYTLRSRGNEWLNVHIRDSNIPHKYTIKGPEPCGVGCGKKLIMLMRDVIIREDPNEELINSLVLPCLSMEIDVQNPQNNTYVISPFIDDNYTETSISNN